jgi:hypothetical protein
MNKALSIALAVAVALLAATSAGASEPTIQPGGAIQAQELGRRNDARLFSHTPQPVLVAGTPDAFDARDAAIGGGAGFAIALLGVAGVAYGVTRRSRPGLSST